MEQNEHSLKRTFHWCFLPSAGPFGQAVSDKIFRFRPIRNKNCLWWPCLLTNRAEISNLHREPSIEASYQVSIHLAERFQRKTFFRTQPIRKKNCSWRPFFCMHQAEISNLYKGPSIDDSSLFSVQLAKRFQRRRFFLIGQSETRIACGSHFCLWIGTKCAIFREDRP